MPVIRYMSYVDFMYFVRSIGELSDKAVTTVF